MKGWVRLAGAAALMALPLLTAACGDEGTAPVGDAAEGTYTLVEVNGAAPPVTVHTDTIGEGSIIEIRVLGGQLALKDDGRYDLTLSGEVWQDGEKLPLPGNITDTGSYGVSGQVVTFDSDNPDLPGTVTGTLAGNDLTETVQHPDYGGFTAVFRK